MRKCSQPSIETLESRLLLSTLPAGLLAGEQTVEASGGSVLAQSLRADDRGNDLAHANTLHLTTRGSATLAGKINYSGDMDYFAGVAQADGLVRIVPAQTSDESNYVLCAYDQNGNLLAQAGGQGMSFQVSAGQKFYISVSAADPGAGAYRFAVLPTLPTRFIPVADVQVPASGTAEVRGTLASDSDNVLCKFQTVGQGVFAVELRADGSDLAPLLQVYNSNGQKVASNGSLSNASGDSRVVLNVKNNQTYYVVASDLSAQANNPAILSEGIRGDADSGQAAGSYLLSLTASPTDDAPNTLAAAKLIRLGFLGGARLSQKIDYLGDVDCMKFVATMTGTMNMTVRTRSGQPAQIAAFQADQSPAAARTYSTGSLSGGISIHVVRGQTYYVQVSEPGVSSDSYTLTLAAAATTPPPTMSPIADQAGSAGSPLAFTVQATGPNGAVLAVTTSALPTGATFDADTRQFQWTPSSQQAGSYAVTFTVSDGLASTSQTVAINIADANGVPVMDPIGDQTVAEGQLLQFVVGATDPDGDPLTYSASNLPSGATFDADTRTFSWTPTYDQAGGYNVVFAASDGTLTGTSPVNITVNNTDRAPVMNAVGNKAVTSGQLLQFVVGAADPDGDSVTYSAANLPSGATFNPTTRTFSWTPGSGQAGNYNVTFTASDGSLTDSSASTIAVAGNVNRAPVVNPVGNQTVAEGQLLQFVVGATDPDGDPLTYSAANLPSGATFDANTYTFSWTPSYSQSGSYNVTFTASDGSLTGSSAATITVSNVDRAPVVNPVGNQMVAEGQLLQFVVGATDPDGDPVTYSAANLPSGATFDANTHTFSWTPSYTQSGSYNVTFTASDGSLTGSAASTITVSNVDRAPVVNPVGNQTVAEGQLLQFVVGATDADGDPLTYSAANLPSGATFDANTHTFSWTPSYSQSGSYNVTFTASDGSLTGSAASTITVSNTDRAPVVNAVGNKTVAEGQLLQFVVGATDPDGDPLTYSAANLPSGATFDANTHTFSWTPSYTQSGSYNVTFTASDGSLTGSAASTITVSNVDRAPTMTAVGNKTVAEGQLLQFVVSATDPDGDPVTYSAANLPSGATFDANTHTFSWTSSYTQSGSYNVTFTASDGTLTGSTASTITVSNTDRAPVVNAVGNKTVAEGQLLQFVVGATDPDGDPVTYSAANLPSGATFDANTHTFSWTPSYTQSGSYNVTFTASDGSLTGSSASTITVSSVNRAPTMSAVGNKTVAEGQLLQFVVSATDPDGDPLTYSASNLPSGATFDANTHTFSWTPSYSQSGSYNVTFAASDGSLMSSSASTITVSDANRPPTLTSVQTLTGACANASFSISYAALAAASNATDPDGQAVSFRIESILGGTLTKNGVAVVAGSTLLGPNETLTWQPSAGATGTLSAFGVRAWDGQAASATAVTVNVRVDAVSSGGPVLDNIAPKVVAPGATVQFTVHATDSSGNTLTYSAQNLPAGATFNAATATFTWTPTANQTGPYTGIRFLASNGTSSGFQDVTITPNLVALGAGATNAYYLDSDGDGYGVASPLGPDADPSDPTVNTSASMLAKYGTLNNFLDHLGYAHAHVYFIATNGNDASGAVNDVSHPYATWAKVETLVRPGDAVIYRAGSYTEGINIGVSGTAGNPITIMAYPGEKVIQDRSWPISVSYQSYINVDGFVVTDSVEEGQYGLQADHSDHLTYRNIESTRHVWGALMMDGLSNLVIENSVFHDNPSEHGIYIGSTLNPNTNITVNGNLLYRNGRNGIQHNGRVTNLVIENNIIHSNALGGISLENGVSYSTVCNNLIFNNDKQGIIFHDDPGDPTNPNILPYPQTNNVVENNTIWVGSTSNGLGVDTPAEYPAIVFNEAAYGNTSLAIPAGSFDNNVIRNNVIVTYAGAIVEFDQQDYADTTTIENNLVYRMCGTQWTAQSDSIMLYGSTSLNMAGFNAFSPLIKNNVFASPMFKDVSLNYNLTPGAFNFDLLAASPALGIASTVGAPTVDLRGVLRTGAIDAGCYQD